MNIVRTLGFVGLCFGLCASLAVAQPPAERGRGGGPPRLGRGEGAGAIHRFPVMMVLDADQNGELSADEIAKAPEALRSLDQNGDGRLTAEEFLPQPFRRAVDAGLPAVERPRQVPQGPDPTVMVERMMRRDQDQNGALSREEAPPRLARVFQRADANGDGQLSRDEVEQMVERWTAQGDRSGGDRPRRTRGER